MVQCPPLFHHDTGPIPAVNYTTILPRARRMFLLGVEVANPDG